MNELLLNLISFLEQMNFLKFRVVKVYLCKVVKLVNAWELN